MYTYINIYVCTFKLGGLNTSLVVTGGASLCTPKQGTILDYINNRKTASKS